MRCGCVRRGTRRRRCRGPLPDGTLKIVMRGEVRGPVPVLADRQGPYGHDADAGGTDCCCRGVGCGSGRLGWPIRGHPPARRDRAKGEGKMSELEPTPELPDNTPLREVHFPTRIKSALFAAGPKTVGEVREMSDEALLALPDFGRTSVAQLWRHPGRHDRQERRRADQRRSVGLAMRLLSGRRTRPASKRLGGQL